MKSFCKNIAIFSAVLCCINGIFAWDVKVINNSSGELIVKVFNAASGICGDTEFGVRKGETKNKKTGICCPISFKVTSKSGPLKGQTVEVDPQHKSGFGLSCMNNTLNVSNISGSLVVEQ